jgi:predicted GNAT superfamily acetyltransferase
VLNQYGTTTSHLHGGLPTDRCVAEWWIGSPRANAIISGEKYQRNPVEARITIPAEIAELRTKDPTQARAIQKQASHEFGSAFDNGLAVIGFEKSDRAGTYLLGKWECK